MPNGPKVSRTQKKPTSIPTKSPCKGSIKSPRVILVEGEADEFIPGVESASGMHGFAIVVPTEQRDGWLLDILWRITMAYAGMPSLLSNRAKVSKMVEAVMSYESRSADVAAPKRAGASKRKPAGSRTGH